MAARSTSVTIRSETSFPESWIGVLIALALIFAPHTAVGAVGAETIATPSGAASLGLHAGGPAGWVLDAKARTPWPGAYQEAKANVNAAASTDLAEFNAKLDKMQKELDTVQKDVEQAKPPGPPETLDKSDNKPLIPVPLAISTSKPVLDVLTLLFLSGLMGMVGQGARTIVGLKKLSDLSNTAPSEADSFDASRIFIGLMIGFIAGVAGGLTPKVFDANAMSGDLLFYLASLGYIGADVVEGFAQTLAGGRKPSAPAGEDGGGDRPEPLVPQGPAHPELKPVEVFRRKAPKIMEDLKKDFDLEDDQAAGILGNLGAECNGFTELQERHPLVRGSQGGYGWAQWTGPRRTLFEKFCRDNGLQKDSDEANYGFLKDELQGSHKYSLDELKAETTLPGAVESFMESFEGPAIPNPGPRIRWAKRALAAFQQTINNA
jgi:hypothetical protein